MARPQARRAHHEFARDEITRAVARFRLHPRHLAVRGADAGDLHVLEAARPARARAFHVGVHHVHRARHPVVREPRAAQEVVGAHQRMEVPDLPGGDHLHAPEPERVVRIGQPPELRQAVPAVRDAHAADLPEPGRLPGLGFELGKEVAGVGAQLGVGVAGPRGADEPRRVPARAGGELPAFEKDDVGPSELREVPGDAGAGHPATDDHRAGALRQRLAHHGLPPVVRAEGRLAEGPRVLSLRHPASMGARNGMAPCVGSVGELRSRAIPWTRTGSTSRRTSPVYPGNTAMAAESAVTDAGVELPLAVAGERRRDVGTARQVAHPKRELPRHRARASRRRQQLEPRRDHR